MESSEQSGEIEPPRVCEARAGEPAAVWDWDALDRAMRPRMIRAGVRKYHLTHEEAEDIVQSVFFHAVRLNPRVRNPISYIATSFRHGCLNFLRSVGRTPPMIEMDADVPDHRIVRELEHRADLNAVRFAFRHVDRPCAELVRWHYLSGNDHATTATRLGYSPRSIGRRLKMCLERIRSWLET